MNIRNLIQAVGWWLGVAVIGFSIPTTAAGSRFAYVTSWSTNDIFSYELNADGTLTQVGMPLHGTGVSPTSMRVDATGRYAYVANQYSAFVSAYKINPDGSLVANGTAIATPGGFPPSTALDPLGRFFFVTHLDGGGHGGLSLYNINSDGTLSVGPEHTLADFPLAAVVDPAGRFVYVAHGFAGSASYVSAFIIEPEGVLIANGTIPAGRGNASVAAHPISPFIYVSNSDSNTVSAYSINPDGTLSLNRTASTGDAFSPTWVAVEPTGRFLYAMTVGGACAVFVLDIDGGLTLTGTVHFAANRFYSFAVDPTGHFVYAVNYDTNDVFIFSIDRATGALEQISGSPFPQGAQASLGMATSEAAAARFAYVANALSDDVSAYSIGPDGALTEIPGSAFPTHWDHFQMTADPMGRHVAYVVNANSNTVATYDIATGGQLSRTSVTPTGDFPVWVAVEPRGRFAYVANANANSVSAYSVVVGLLSPIDGSPFEAGRSPVAVAVEQTGNFAYVLNNEDTERRVRSTVFAYRIDQATGALLTPRLGTATAGLNALAIIVDPTGRFVYVVNGGYLREPDPEPGSIAAYAIQGDGTLAPVAGSPFQLDPGNRGYANSVAMDPAGNHLYVTGQSSAGRWVVFGFDINEQNGALSLVPGSPFEAIAFPQSIAVDHNGDFAYVVSNGEPTANLVSAYRIQPNGALVQLRTAATGTDPISVAADTRVSLLYVANYVSNSISVFDTAAGNLTPVPGSPFRDGYLSSVTTTHGVRPRFAYMTNTDLDLLSADSINGARRPWDDPASGSLDIEQLPTLAGHVPVSAAVDPLNRYIYVANYGSPPSPGDISCYKINVDGSLAPNGAVAAGIGPKSLTVDPNGRYVYVANEASDDINAYRINPDGTLAPNGRKPAGFSPISVVVDGTGRYVYTANSGSNSITGYDINSDGSLGNPVPGSPFEMSGSPTSATVGANSTGQFVYVAIDDVGQPTVAAFEIDGVGALVPIGNRPIGRGPVSVTVDPTFQFIYVANAVSSNISAYRINLDGTLGDAIPGQPFATREIPTSMTTTW